MNISHIKINKIKITQNSVIFNTVLFSSLLLNLLNLKIFEQTIVSIKIISFFYVLGVLAFILFKNKLKQLSPWNHINNFIFCLFVVGSYSTFAVLGPNYYFADKSTENKIYKIITKRKIPGPKYNWDKKKPAVIVKTEKDNTKRIKFNQSMSTKVDKAGFLELELSHGFFNFDIIRSTTLR